MLTKRANSGERRGHFLTCALACALTSDEQVLFHTTLQTLLSRCLRDSGARLACIEVSGCLLDPYGVMVWKIVRSQRGMTLSSAVLDFAEKRSKEPDFSKNELVIYFNLIAGILKTGIQYELEHGIRIDLDGLGKNLSSLKDLFPKIPVSIYTLISKSLNLIFIFSSFTDIYFLCLHR